MPKFQVMVSVNVTPEQRTIEAETLEEAVAFVQNEVEDEFKGAAEGMLIQVKTFGCGIVPQGEGF